MRTKGAGVGVSPAWAAPRTGRCCTARQQRRRQAGGASSAAGVCGADRRRGTRPEGAVFSLEVKRHVLVGVVFEVNRQGEVPRPAPCPGVEQHREPGCLIVVAGLNRVLPAARVGHRGVGHLAAPVDATTQASTVGAAAVYGAPVSSTMIGSARGFAITQPSAKSALSLPPLLRGAARCTARVPAVLRPRNQRGAPPISEAGWRGHWRAR